MGISLEKLTEEALALSAESRALLADRLNESLETPFDEDLQALWAVEASRRRDEVRAGKVKTIPASAALVRIRKSLNG